MIPQEAPQRRLRWNALVKLGSEAIGRLATFALALLVANRLGEGAFGYYSFAIALGFVVSQLADLGLQMLVAREVAVRGHSARAVVRKSLGLKVLLSVPVVLILLGTIRYQPEAVRLPLFLFGLALLAQTYLEFAVYVFRGLRQIGREAAFLTVARLVAAGTAATAILLGGELTAVSAAYLGSVGILALAALLAVHRDGWLAPIRPVTPGPAAGHILRQALPLGIAVFLSIGYTRLAVFLLAYQIDEVAVATFSAAQRLVEPMQIIPAALMAAVFPAFSSALHHAPAEAGKLGARSTLLLAGVGVLLTGSFWLTAPFLVPLLYGAAFVAAVPVLQILGLSILPAFVNYSLTHILIARGQQRLTSIFVALMLTLHAVVSWQLIPLLGPIGPAIAMTGAELLLLVCCLFTLALTRPGLQRATISVS